MLSTGSVNNGRGLRRGITILCDVALTELHIIFDEHLQAFQQGSQTLL
jgi:hypothetical protein